MDIGDAGTNPRTPDDPLEKTSGGADVVVRRLVNHVLSEGLTPGDSLPTVRDLSKRWKMGRNLVRDGLLRAQVLGLVEVRPRSGVVVRAVDYSPLVEALSQTMAVALRQQDPNLVHVWQARAIIEMETAAAAARRRLPEDLQRLQSLITEMGQSCAERLKFVEADDRFHLEIARIGGNPVIVFLLEALLKVLRPHKLALVPLPPNNVSPERTIAVHTAIHNVIADGNPEEASRIMGEHCQRHATHLLYYAAPDKLPGQTAAKRN